MRHSCALRTVHSWTRFALAWLGQHIQCQTTILPRGSQNTSDKQKIFVEYKSRWHEMDCVSVKPGFPSGIKIQPSSGSISWVHLGKHEGLFQLGKRQNNVVRKCLFRQSVWHKTHSLTLKLPCGVRADPATFQSGLVKLISESQNQWSKSTLGNPQLWLPFMAHT